MIAPLTPDSAAALAKAINAATDKRYLEQRKQKIRGKRNGTGNK